MGAARRDRQRYQGSAAGSSDKERSRLHTTPGTSRAIHGDGNRSSGSGFSNQAHEPRIATTGGRPSHDGESQRTEDSRLNRTISGEAGQHGYFRRPRVPQQTHLMAMSKGENEGSLSRGIRTDDLDSKGEDPESNDDGEDPGDKFQDPQASRTQRLLIALQLVQHPLAVLVLLVGLETSLEHALSAP